MAAGTFSDNEFLPTLGQAVRLRELSRDAANAWDAQVFATAAIFFSSAAVEGAANGLVQTLQLGPKVLDQVDRFPVLEKFEMVMNSRGKHLDRGCAAVQGLRDLIKSRNAIVHPKLSSTDIEYQTLPGNEQYALHHVASGYQPASVHTEYSRAADAVESAILFLDYAVADVLNLEQSEAERSLLARGPTALERPAYHLDSLRALLRYQSETRLVRFLHLPTIPGEGGA